MHAFSVAYRPEDVYISELYGGEGNPGRRAARGLRLYRALGRD
jgi:hypothetical protein